MKQTPHGQQPKPNTNQATIGDTATLHLSQQLPFVAAARPSSQLSQFSGNSLLASTHGEMPQQAGGSGNPWLSSVTLTSPPPHSYTSASGQHQPSVATSDTESESAMFYSVRSEGLQLPFAPPSSSAPHAPSVLESVNFSMDSTTRTPHLLKPSTTQTPRISRPRAVNGNVIPNIYAEPSAQPVKPRIYSAYDKLLPDGDDPLVSPSTAMTKQATTSAPSVGYKDVAFSAVFSFGFAVMTILGLFYLFSTKPLSDEFKQTLFYAFQHSSSFLARMLIFSFAFGMLWIAFLRRFLWFTVWTTVLVVPTLFFSLTVWGLVVVYASPSDLGFEAAWVIVEAIVSFGLGILSSFLIHKKKASIGKSVQLIEIAFQILADNPSLIIVCLGLLIGYMSFSVVWLALFTRITLLGHLEANDTKWIPSPSSAWIAAYFIFFFLWTSAVFHYIERYTISGVVCEWYFHRHDPVKIMWKKDLPVHAMSRALTVNFGSICFAGLILTAVQSLRMLSRAARKASRLASGDSAISKFLATSVEVIEAYVEGFNSYALVYVAYDGTDFCSAARKCAGLFKRNLFGAFLTDNLTKFILLLGVYGASMACFMTAFTVSVNELHTPFAWAISSIGAVLGFFMVRFSTLILVQIMDALYVCFVIDTDTGSCNSQAVHMAFMDGKFPVNVVV